MDVHAYMAEHIPLIDAAIEARLPLAEAGAGQSAAEGQDVPLRTAMPKALLGAMRHLLFPGGKRLRPIFAIAAAEAVGGSARQAMPIAVATELLHTYSLIHDDLPCMDDDDERRGRPTVHRAFDEATAVLAGDALLTEAFGVLAEGPEGADSGASAEDILRARLWVIERLSVAGGALGLVGGQVDDLAFSENTEAQGTKAEWLASIHARKTAALFQAAVVGGAALGHAKAHEREVLDAFANDVGIAFQIADDVLDAPSEEAASILRLQGIDDAQAGAEALLDRALDRIEGWGERAEPLRALARFAVRRKQ